MLYLGDQLRTSYVDLLQIPWGKRKRLINEHHELQMLRQRKQEEAVRQARSKR